jgi:hypothetical protein
MSSYDIASRNASCKETIQQDVLQISNPDPITGLLTDLGSFLVSIFISACAHDCKRGMLLNAFPDVLHVMVLSETKVTGRVILKESEGDIQGRQKPVKINKTVC